MYAVLLKYGLIVFIFLSISDRSISDRHLALQILKAFITSDTMTANDNVMSDDGREDEVLNAIAITHIITDISGAVNLKPYANSFITCNEVESKLY